MPFDLEAIRQELPILGSEVYLNTGGTGPLPIPVVRAINEAAEHQLGIARMGPAGVGLTDITMAKLRAATAKLVGGSAADMAITSNTTIGLGRDMRILGDGMEKSANKTRGSSSGDTSGAPVY